MVGLAFCLLTTACGGGPGALKLTNVPVPAPASRAACADLIRALPSSLGGDLDRRELDPPQESAAAYGRTPAVITCGAAGVPASYRPTSDLSVVNDVGWFAETIGAGVRFSTPTRSPHVVLTLPTAALRDLQPFDVLVVVAPAVRGHSVSTTA
ncbi:DUF3515 family protein [Frankia sp. AgKG'84/4]|uniref:DUF3515 family protein n=1 Tax=Frankia sp. AgKG'84/4 TaxID=573490 RepID=UPI0027E52056|nr:DUF3515 family protein [Frankia sp. AgKG'84/4]